MISTIGSHGDIPPLVALGKGWQVARHDGENGLRLNVGNTVRFCGIALYVSHAVLG